MKSIKSSQHLLFNEIIIEKEWHWKIVSRRCYVKNICSKWQNGVIWQIEERKAPFFVYQNRPMVLFFCPFFVLLFYKIYYRLSIFW